MARVTRNQLLYEGCYAHVISRSMRKEKIFKDSEDSKYFLKLLLAIKQEYPFKIFHYCLMQTHFHFVVQILSVSEFARGLSKLKSQYVFKYHEKYKLTGPIWRERYKSLLIEDEVYMLACGKYVENNPVKAGLVEKPEEWKESSAGYYLKGIADELIDGYDRAPVEKNIKIFSNENFEQGDGIGSDYFKFQLRKKLR